MAGKDRKVDTETNANFEHRNDINKAVFWKDKFGGNMKNRLVHNTV